MIADYSEVCIINPDQFLHLHISIFNCSYAISIWMHSKHLQDNISQIKLLTIHTQSWYISDIAYFNKWHICNYSIKIPRSISKLFLPSQPISNPPKNHFLDIVKTYPESNHFSTPHMLIKATIMFHCVWCNSILIFTHFLPWYP